MEDPPRAESEGEVTDFRRVFESAQTLHLALLPNPPIYTIVAASDAYTRQTKTTRDDIIGRGIFEVFPDNPDDPNASGERNLRLSLDRVVDTRAANAMAVQKYDIRRPVSEGGGFEERFWSPINSPVFDADGRLVNIIHRVEDVTEFIQQKLSGQQQAERMAGEIYKRSQEVGEANRALAEKEHELLRLNERLQVMNRLKSEFFSNVSHEFRTPITLMLGPLGDLLARQDLAEQVRQPIALTHRNAIRLLKLVNSLLDFARLEAGQLEGRFRPVDFAAFVAGIASQFSLAMDKAHLKFVVTCPTVSQAAYLDTDLFEKVILNLLSNALKFTLQGSIEVAVTEVDGKAVVTVRDSGVGIPRHELPRIFERFHRVEGSRGRSFEGTGIGLALVRELVDLHGGSVSAESEEGHGSVFTVALPLGRAHLPPERVVDQASLKEAPHDAVTAHLVEAFGWIRSDSDCAPAPPHSGGIGPACADPALPAGPRPRIVLADDSADMRGYVHSLLASRYDVVPTANGVEALASIRREPPDLVLTDVMMPEMDGFALLRELRVDERTCALPVILLSARSGEEASVTGLDAGADDYLIKPFSATELVARIESNLRLCRIRAELARTEAARLAALQHGKELASVNAELEQFAFVAAHDLQEPLYTISLYTEMLLRKLATPDPQLQGYGERVRSAAQRMRTLLTDLLTYSRVVHQPVGETVAHADLNAAVAQAQQTLSDALTRSGAQVTSEQLPVVRGDVGQLAVVFQNLLGNALKYQASGSKPEVSVSVRQAGGRWIVSVRDNGIGFPPEHAERIFGLFKRLHGDRYPGTGLGLAICRRIVERDGGRLWAESAGEGSGATFFIELQAVEGGQCVTS